MQECRKSSHVMLSINGSAEVHHQMDEIKMEKPQQNKF